MRILVASIVIAPLMLSAALPAAAGQWIPSGTPIHLAASGASRADRDTYNQKAQDAMGEWQRKLHNFAARAKAKGQAENNAAWNELNMAWIKADTEQHKLQSASAEGWEGAKISFKKASHDLKVVWDKFRPDDK